MREHLAAGHSVVIYPEAHVWNYYTGIRPFSTAAFAYPVENNTPCFTMTTVYRKPLICKRPRIKVYIDGPFYAEQGMNHREQRQRLCEIVRQAMQDRAALSDYEYIHYEQRTGNSK